MSAISFVANTTKELVVVVAAVVVVFRDYQIKKDCVPLPDQPCLLS